MLSQTFYLIIENGISVLGPVREVLDGLNATGKMFLPQLMSTVQLPVTKMYDKQMVIYYTTSTNDASRSRE